MEDKTFMQQAAVAQEIIHDLVRRGSSSALPIAQTLLIALSLVYHEVSVQMNGGEKVEAGDMTKVTNVLTRLSLLSEQECCALYGIMGKQMMEREAVSPDVILMKGNEEVH